MNEIDKSAVFGGKLRIWQRGHDSPSLAIDPNSKNYGVLALLLDDWARQRREDGEIVDADPGATGLGRLLFERRSIDQFTHNLIAGIHMFAFLASIFIGHHFRLAMVFGLAFGMFESAFGRFRIYYYELGVVPARMRRRTPLDLRRNHAVQLRRHSHEEYGHLPGNATATNFSCRAIDDQLFAHGKEFGSRPGMAA